MPSKRPSAGHRTAIAPDAAIKQPRQKNEAPIRRHNRAVDLFSSIFDALKAIDPVMIHLGGLRVS
jgi:hypothetical protein